MSVEQVTVKTVASRPRVGLSSVRIVRESATVTPTKGPVRLVALTSGHKGLKGVTILSGPVIFYFEGSEEGTSKLKSPSSCLGFLKRKVVHGPD